MSGAIAVAVFLVYPQALAVLGHDRYRVAQMQIAAGMLAITALINAFYFVKIFPPLPLVLSDAGIYHSIQRAGRDFQVAAEDEPPRWQALFGSFPVEHIQVDDKLYLYSAVFAPFRLSADIVHRWEWLDPKNNNWLPQQTVPFTIRGGREDGCQLFLQDGPQAGPVAGEYRHLRWTRHRQGALLGRDPSGAACRVRQNP